MIFDGDVTPQQVLDQIGGYQAFIPDDAMIEHDGKQVPLKSMPDIVNAKDLPTLAKGLIESQREIGRRERVPGKDAKPEDVAAFKAKLIERGVLPAPIASPADYGIAKPEEIQDAFWNEELATGLATVLHKYQVPKEAASELLVLHQQAMNGAKTILDTSVESGMAALKAEHGDQFEERAALAGRFATMIFKSPEELAMMEKTGLANHPAFLSVLMRLAPYAQQDSSFVQGMEESRGPLPQDEAIKEHMRVMNDPKHEHYAGYRKGDPKALAFVDSLYRKPAGATA